MTAPVDALTPDEVRALLAIAHLAPLAVDYDDEAWTAAGCPSDKTTRDARDRFARMAPRMVRDLLAARDRIAELERELAEAVAGRKAWKEASNCHFDDDLAEQRQRVERAEAERDRLREQHDNLVTARNEMRARHLDKIRELGRDINEARTALAEFEAEHISLRQERESLLAERDRLAQDRDRLRAALKELGPREHAGMHGGCDRGLHGCAPACRFHTCGCGADEHNAKVAAALKGGGT